MQSNSQKHKEKHFLWSKSFICFLFVILCLGQNCMFAGIEEKGKEDKTVFITGAAGFIGSNFLEYMFEKYPGYHFVVLDALTYAGSLDNIPSYIQQSERFKFIKGSVTDFALVDSIMSTAHFVVHFAAESHVARSITEADVFFDANVIGTLSMIKALLKYVDKVERFIHISTSEVYGTAEYVPMDELHPINPRSPYAASKAAADRLVYAYNCTYDLPTVIVRPFNNYGPKQHVEKMIPRFIVSAINKEPLTIHGSGDQVRDWVHTYDVSIALDKILHLPDFAKIKNQVLNIASAEVVSTLDIAKMILKRFNLPEATYLKFVEDRPGQVKCHAASSQKAQELLNWKPSINMQRGLEMTIDWYINHPSYWIEKEQRPAPNENHMGFNWKSILNVGEIHAICSAAVLQIAFLSFIYHFTSRRNRASNLA